jgi:hypothetical protein
MDRSKLPLMMVSVTAHAAMPTSAFWLRMFSRFSPVRKSRAVTAK